MAGPELKGSESSGWGNCPFSPAGGTAAWTGEKRAGRQKIGKNCKLFIKKTFFLETFF